MDNSTIETNTLFLTLIVAVALWELLWKGIALWKAARLHDTAWYVVMLLVNSLGIIPIIYILTHRQQTNAPVTESQNAQQ